MKFTEKELIELIDISQQGISKALKKSEYSLQKVIGSAKKVKHYRLEDLPLNYQNILKEKGVEKKKEETNISKANFTNKYLLASSFKQNEAALRCELIEKYLKKDDSISAKKFLENVNEFYIEFDDLGTITERKLFTWLEKYNEARIKGTNVVESLLDTRGSQKGTTTLTSEMQETAIRYFLKTTRVKIKSIHQNMCFKYGDLMPSYKVLNTFYKKWQKENIQLSEFAKSPDSWKNKYQVAFGSISEKAKYRNQYWELDSTPADVICSNGKRYAVLGMIDVYSRRCIFHVSETSNSYSISQLLRKAILKMGVPETVVIDNGKDYRSNHFQSVCLNLGINMEIVPPYSGDMKPHIERVFRTLSGQLFEELDGYIGHNVAQRAELQARKSFASKQASKYKHNQIMKVKTKEERAAFREAWKLKKDNLGLQLNILMSSEELQKKIDLWNTKLYEQENHGTLKMSPIKKWNDSSLPVKGIPDERMLDLLLGENIIRTVGKKGIRYDGAEYQSIELIEFIGHKVHCLVPSDWGKIVVYSESMIPICIAEDPEKLGRNRYEVRAAKKKHISLAKQWDKLIHQIEKYDDVSIVDRAENSEIIESIKTTAVTKRTEIIDIVTGSAPILESQDKKSLEKSKKYDFKNKNEEGKAQKILPSGRPLFSSYIKRFVWDLENKMVDESTEKLATDYPEMWEMAKKEAKVG